MAREDQETDDAVPEPHDGEEIVAYSGDVSLAPGMVVIHDEHGRGKVLRELAGRAYPDGAVDAIFPVVGRKRIAAHLLRFVLPSRKAASVSVVGDDSAAAAKTPGDFTSKLAAAEAAQRDSGLRDIVQQRDLAARSPLAIASELVVDFDEKAYLLLPGMVVVHERFGRGSIFKVWQGSGVPNTVVEALFPPHGLRKVEAKYLKLAFKSAEDEKLARRVALEVGVDHIERPLPTATETYVITKNPYRDHDPSSAIPIARGTTVDGDSPAPTPTRIDRRSASQRGIEAATLKLSAAEEAAEATSNKSAAEEAAEATSNKSAAGKAVEAATADESGGGKGADAVARIVPDEPPLIVQFNSFLEKLAASAQQTKPMLEYLALMAQRVVAEAESAAAVSAQTLDSPAAVPEGAAVVVSPAPIVVGATVPAAMASIKRVESIQTLRRFLNGDMLEFLGKEGFGASDVIEAVAWLVVQLSRYQEEGVVLFPRFVVCDQLSDLTPNVADPIQIGVGPRDVDTMRRALKKCAPLARDEWVAYVRRTVNDPGEAQFEFGVFREQGGVLGIDLRDSFVSSMIPSPPGRGLVLISQVANRVVELVGVRGRTLTYHLSAADDSQPSPLDAIGALAEAMTAAVDEEIRDKVKTFLVSVLVDVLRRGHGTLIAIAKPGEVPEALKQQNDSVSLEHAPVDIAACVRGLKEKNTETIGRALAYAKLIEGFLSTDGITVFETDGRITRYNAFIKAPPSIGTTHAASEGERADERSWLFAGWWMRAC